jgi:hypothetical protein
VLKIVVDLVILRIVFSLTWEDMDMNVGYSLPCVGSILLSIADLVWGRLELRW